MVSKYQISNYEVAVTVEDIYGSTINKAKVAISKFMANMKTGNYETKKPINRNLFINASDCAIKPSAVINTRGYCTLEKYSTEVINLANKTSEDSNGNIYIPKGTKLLVEVLYEDKLNMHITGKE